MSWDGFVGHQTQRDLLCGTITRRRLAHTYLFVGPEGIGKRTFALKFAQCLLCQRHSEFDFEACETCPGCKQVLARTHPDLYVVGCPEGKREIPIDTFLGPPERRGKEGLCHDLSHTPMAGGRKVALICDAEKLNEESANALLKTLEEPPPHSLIILIANQIDSILPTIRSRCQVLRFNPLSAADITDLLLRNGTTTDPEAAANAAAGSEGSLTQAAVLLDETLRSQRDQLFDLLSASKFNSLAVAGFVMEGVEGAGSEAPVQREQAGWYFRFCVEFFRSAMSEMATQRPARIPQVTRFIQHCQPATVEHLTNLTQIIERIVTASTHLDQNVTVPLTVEALFDDIGKMLRSVSA